MLLNNISKLPGAIIVGEKENYLYLQLILLGLTTVYQADFSKVKAFAADTKNDAEIILEGCSRSTRRACATLTFDLPVRNL